MNLKMAWPILKDTVHEFYEDRVLRLSAALAYYAMFSIGPLLVIVIGLAGMVFGSARVHDEIARQLQDFMGPGAARVIESMTAHRQQSSSLVATAVGVVALLLGATGVFAQLQDSLNTIWEVKPRPGRALLGILKDRFLSFAMVLGIGFLLLVSMALTAFLTAFAGSLHGVLPVPSGFAQSVNFAVSFAVITLLFAAIFKILPDVKIRWRDVWVGALGTALLFSIGKYLLGLYLALESTVSAYGAAGSVIVILLWVYYASVILFFGAEFTQVYARRSGPRILPNPIAVTVTEEERSQQGMPSPETVASGVRSQDAQPKPIPPAPLPAHPPKKIAIRPLRLLGLAAVAGLVIGSFLPGKTANQHQPKR
jgi:membrane protein